MLRKLFALSTLGIAALFTASICLAKNINLYDQPKTDAKIIGAIDPSAGIVPIYTPSQSEWVKVGDPHNGNVGWVKTGDLANAGPVATGFSFSQQIKGQQPQPFIMQVGMPPQLTPEQSAQIMKQVQQGQATMLNSLQKTMQQVYTNAGLPPPVIMPIIMVPQQEPNATVLKPQPATPVVPSVPQK